VHGKPTTASGLVVLPVGGPRRLPTIDYEHGTRAYRGGVASVIGDNGDREGAELFASAGYAVVAPDYLGLGTGPGTHPYMDVGSEVSASVDMLRAAKQFVDGRPDVALDDTVRVTGFSQGGTAAMATAEALQNGVDRWRLTAIAPISGPYDVGNTELPALVDHPGDGPGQIDSLEGVFYIAYWTVAQNRLHHFYRDPAEVFQAPYASTVEQLFDGNHPDEDISTALPANPAALLTPAYAERLRHPTGPLLAAIRENDRTCQWRPRVPIQLYAADGDRDVPIANARACQVELGRWAPLVDVGNVDHTGSALASVPKILDWFVTL
jgi:pimeloyl-ACP methyl ester carboxylesterase